MNQLKICDWCGIQTHNVHLVTPQRCERNPIGLHDWIPYYRQGNVTLKSVHPEDQGNRDVRRSRHDLIPLEFLDELASIFEEGLPKYGDSWKKGGRDFLIDCLNHASNHLHKYCNGDISENQLSKVAWNVLVVRYFDLKGEGLNENTRTPKNE